MQPATKFNDLIERAQALGNKNGLPDELEIRRIEREASIMRRSGAVIAGSWEVIAMCAAFVFLPHVDLDAEGTLALEAELYPGLAAQNFPAERNGRVIIGFRSRPRNADADNI